MNKLLIAVLLLTWGGSVTAKEYRLQSPSGKITAEINCGDELDYSVSYDGREVLAVSPISMTLGDGTVRGPKAKVSKAVRRSNESVVESPFSQSATMADSYNALTLQMKGD